MAVLLAPSIRMRLRNRSGSASTALERVPIDRTDVALAEGLLPDTEATASPPYDRVFRIVSWTFLMAVALIVAGSGLWSDRLPRIVVWIAIAGGFTLVIHDLTPGRLPAT